VELEIQEAQATMVELEAAEELVQQEPIRWQ
jgi:hypothetical protein